MELKDLVGKHFLSGVDHEVEKAKPDGGGDANVIRFVLDDVTYTATEDPEDGYRNSMKEIAITTNTPVVNTFPKVEIYAKMRDTEDFKDNKVLEIFDAKNKKLILEVGTEDYNNWYPCWVASFTPENMSINESLFTHDRGINANEGSYR